METLQTTAEVTLEASSPRKFQIEAYSGGKMRHPAFDVPVVVDLTGLSVAKESLPILTDHTGTVEASVGHTSGIDVGNSVVARGVFSGANEATREVIDKLEAGMPLQASVGIRYKVANRRLVDEGERVAVNGRTFDGPLVLIATAELYEISVVPLGADEQTSVRLAASQFKELHMTEFETWATALGVDLEKASADQMTKLQAAFRAEETPNKPAPESVVEPEAADEVLAATIEPAKEPDVEVDLKATREARAAEAERCDAIESLCAKYDNPSIEVDGEEKSLKAHAIAEGWGEEKTELHALRNSRPTPSIHKKTSQVHGNEVFEASLLLQANAGEEAFKGYSDKTLEAANSVDLRRISVQYLMGEAIFQATGVRPAAGISGDSLIAKYKEATLHAATGFTTYSLANVLGAVANKMSWEGVQNAPSRYRKLTRRYANRNFQTHTHVRLEAGETYEEVGNDGEIKQGRLHEETWTSDLVTYATTLSLTRQDIINDDLSLFNDLPRQLGRDYEIEKDKRFFALLESPGAGFYDDTDGVSSQLASTTLSDAGLTNAYIEWAKKVDVRGELLGIMPSILLVPPALYDTALRLMNSRELITGANATIPSFNSHVGRYTVMESPRLTNADHFYLMTDPSDVPVFADVTLNGQDGPTIESEPAPFDVLGTRWRAYYDSQFAAISNDGILSVEA